VPAESRPEILKQSQEKVASVIIQSIKKRRTKVILSPFGKLTAIVFRYAPRLALSILIFSNKKKYSKETKF
jgi:short-subunit dehydrogenase